jgi:5'-nucleotidase
MNNKPLAFVTNDDGIQTLFIHELVFALKKDFDVIVAAPKTEQSWIGRAVSRRKDIEVTAYEGLGCPAWEVDGSPTDCANIGLSHLCPRRPDIVVSGINLGFNYTYPMILSSGTVAGAIEGALWGIPAMAVSKAIPLTEFEMIRESGGKLSGAPLESLLAAAEHSRKFALKIMGETPSGITVHNINYPEVTNSDTPVKMTYPGEMKTGPLFKLKKGSQDVYDFGFKVAEVENDDQGSDIYTVRNGEISYCLLDYSRLCKLG